MLQAHKMIIGVITGALVLVSAGLAIAMSHDGVANEREKKHLRLACHRGVGERALHGIREMKTVSYEEEAPNVGIVKGSLKSELRSNRWTTLAWTCRINPTSRRVLSIEFGWTNSGSRLLAAARLRG